MEGVTPHPALNLQVTIPASGIAITQTTCLGKRCNASSACQDSAETDEAQYAPAFFTNFREEEFQ